MTYGITEHGFENKPFLTILSEIKTDFKSLYPNIDLADDGPFGQFTNLFADRFSSIWNLMQALYTIQNPDSVEGVAQDNLYALNNLVRQGATYTKLPRVAITAPPATVIPAGGLTVSSTIKPGYMFKNLTAETVPASGICRYYW